MYFMSKFAYTCTKPIYVVHENKLFRSIPNQNKLLKQLNKKSFLSIHHHKGFNAVLAISYPFISGYSSLNQITSILTNFHKDMLLFYINYTDFLFS